MFEMIVGLACIVFLLITLPFWASIIFDLFKVLAGVFSVLFVFGTIYLAVWFNPNQHTVNSRMQSVTPSPITPTTTQQPTDYDAIFANVPKVGEGQPVIAAIGDDLLQRARDAIARGAPRDKVIERLRAIGINPAGLFDDLIPQQPAKTGMFDDLIPQQAPPAAPVSELRPWEEYVAQPADPAHPQSTGRIPPR